MDELEQIVARVNEIAQSAAEKLTAVRRRHCNCTLPTPLQLHVAHLYRQQLTTNGAHPPSTSSTPWLTSLGCLNSRTRTLQYSLLQTYVQSCLHLGASISRSPSRGSLNISSAACLSMRVRSRRRMCPSHWSRLALIQRTRWNVRHFADASWCTVFPVITLIILAFAPFSVAIISLVRCHASDP